MRVWIGLLVVVAISFGASFAFGKMPQTIGYQGYLTTRAGTPVSNSTNVTFSLYSSNPHRNNPVWRETQSVTPSNGVYTVELGAVNPIAAQFDAPYYLGIQVASDSEMTPLLPLTGSAYSFRAAVADNASSIGGVTLANLPPGSLLYSNGNGGISVLSPGTSGQSLTMTNAGPTWTNSVGLTVDVSQDVGSQITSLCRSHPGATIRIPAGRYTYATPGDFLGCTIEGEGDASQLKYTGTGGYALQAINPTANLTIGVTFTATSGASGTIAATGIGAAFPYITQDQTVSNLASYGIDISGTSRNNASFYVTGITLNSISVTRKDNANFISEVVNSGTTVYIGGSVGTTSVVRNLNLFGGGSKGNSIGIGMVALVSGLVENSYVSGFGSYGISVIGQGKVGSGSYDIRDTHDIQIRDNRIFGNGDSGIYWGGAGGGINPSFVHNSIDFNQGWGIEASASESPNLEGQNEPVAMSITMNKLRENSKGSILINGPYGLQVSANSLTNIVINDNYAHTYFGFGASISNNELAADTHAGSQFRTAAVSASRIRGLSIYDNWYSNAATGYRFVELYGVSTVDLKVPDCNRVYVSDGEDTFPSGLGSANIACSDDNGQNQHYSSWTSNDSPWNFGNAAPTKISSNSQYPTADFQTWNSGQYAVEYQPIKVTALSSNSSGGSLHNGVVYRCYATYTDATGRESAMGPWMEQTDVNGYTIPTRCDNGADSCSLNIATSALPSYGVARRYYCKSDGTMDAPTYCGNSSPITSCTGTLYGGTTGFAASWNATNAYTTGSIQTGSRNYAGLGTVPAPGTQIYCADCGTTPICTGAGTGHMAVSNGINWTCQ